MDMSRIIMHIDVNNAFLSWTAVELLKKGHKVDIRTIEAVIGGDEAMRHGIVLAKSPVAKKRGVKTAETLREAKRKCQNLKVYPPNYQWYSKMSKALFQIVSKYTPDIEILSIDECFIDYTKVHSLHGNPIDFAYHLKDEIYQKLGFTVNIGVANNKLCAKMASDFLKPNRVHTLWKEEVENKMYPLEIGELYGVGKKSALKLRELGILTIGDLAHSTESRLKKHFKNQAIPLILKAQGIDDSPVIVEEEESKGISNSTTFSYNLTKEETIFKNLQALVENVCLSLRKSERFAYVVGVTIRNRNFVTYSHQKKLVNPTSNTDEIMGVIKDLFLECWDEEPIRLLGVSLTNLTSSCKRQLSLFEAEETVERNKELEKVVDKLKEQYGSTIIKRASLVDNNISKKYD